MTVSGAPRTDREDPAGTANRRLDSILQCAARARDIVTHGRAEWDRDVILQLASEALVIRIGEAVKAIPRDHLPDVPDISWRRVATVRDFYAHNQHKIDPNALWGELVHEVPRVARAVQRWQAGQQLANRGARDLTHGRMHRDGGRSR